MYIRDFGITMEALLLQDSLADARLLAGVRGLTRIVTEVRQAQPEELAKNAAPDVLYLVGPPNTGDDPVPPPPVLQALADAGAAGLGLVGGGTPPQQLAQLANTLALPLVALPAGTDVQGLANQVLTFVLENQAQLLDKIQDLNRSLTSTMLHGGNLQEICEILYQRFGNSVAISSDFLSSYELNTTDENRAHVAAVLEEEKRNAFLGRQETPTGLVRQTSLLGGHAYSRITIPIFSDNRLLGRIYMWEDHTTVSGVELSVLESVTSLIALDMMKKMSILNLENSNRGGFLRDLLTGDRRLYQKAQSNARYYDLDTRAAHQVMVIRFSPQGGQGRAGRDTLYAFNTNLISIIQQTVRNTVIKTIYANQGDQIIVLMETTPHGGEYLEQPLRDFLDELDQRFQRENIADLASIGIGREYRSMAELYKSFSEAKRALACPGGGTIVFFEEMGVFRLLTYEGIQAEAELFCEQRLHPLLAYDREKDGFLVSTLAAYFVCSGNTTRLAEYLGVHYNTAANRLQKIEELLGARLDDAGAALDLQIALRILEMKNDDPAAG